MKFISFRIIALSLVLLSGSCQSDDNLFGPLSDVEGKWSMTFGDSPESGSIVETWEKVNDTLFAGQSYEVVNGDSTLVETIQLVASNGEIFYIPITQQQNDRKPVTFRLTRTEGRKFTFENPEHDFTTNIVYDFQNDTTLNASISGMIRGDVKGMDFKYTKVSN